MRIHPIIANWIIATFALFLVTPVMLPGQNGAYNTITRRYACSTNYACLHEMGHFLDQTHGWVSHSPEWTQALKIYVLSEIGSGNAGEPLAYYIISEKLAYHPWWVDENSEIYAEILAKSGGDPGNMPANLRSFYDWDWLERMQR